MITPSYGLTATERVLPRLALDWTTGLAQTGVDVTRAGTSTYIDIDGVLQDASADTQRIDYATGIGGLLIEESRANSIRNNTMQGASVGTPPTNWVVFGNTGLSASVVGVSSENGVNYIDVRFQGATPTAVDSSVSFEQNTQIAAASGQTWAASFFATIVDGDTSNITETRVQILERNGAGGFVTAGSSIFSLSSGNLSQNRFSHVRTLSGGTTAFVSPQFIIKPSGAGAVDITVRIGLPQMELGAFPTSVIKTTTTAVTRNADVATMTGTNFSDWFNASEGTFKFSFQRYTGITGVTGIGNIGDGTTAERMRLYYNSATQTRFDMSDGGVSQGVLATSITANAPVSMIAAYKENNMAASSNGGATSVDTSCTLPTVNQLAIGALGTLNQLCGVVTKLYYWPQRLTNAEVQSFSK